MAPGGPTDTITTPAIETLAPTDLPDMLIRVDLVDEGERLRSVNPARVAEIATSVAETRLLHPITVRPVNGRFQLVAGAHRLAAFRLLDRDAIPAKVRHLDDLEARQLEIDENLIGPTLTALERLTFLAERVEVWADRNPDRVVADVSRPPKLRGRPPKAFLKLRKGRGYVPEMMGFAKETARDTGLSRQSIYRAVQTLAALPVDTRIALRGTWMASNDSVLRQLAGLADPAEQAAVIEVLLAGKTKNVANARAIAAGNAPIQPARTDSNALQADFERLWKKASPAQRDGLLHWLAGQPLPKGWTITGGGA